MIQYPYRITNKQAAALWRIMRRELINTNCSDDRVLLRAMVIEAGISIHTRISKE
jgi:hypothetical protein